MDLELSAYFKHQGHWPELQCMLAGHPVLAVGFSLSTHRAKFPAMQCMRAGQTDAVLEVGWVSTEGGSPAS